MSINRKNKHSEEAQLISRRRFLGYLTSAPLLGLSTSPAIALFTSILSGESQKAWAAELGVSARRLILIHHGGGPDVSMADLFFTPYSTAGFNPNPFLATQFGNVGGRYTQPAYVTHTIKGIQAPTAYTHMLPAPGGGLRPASDLLDGLLAVQGLDTRNAGHDASTMWAHRSPGAKQSTAALAGDPSNTPFAALNLGTTGYSYASSKGKSSVSIGTGGDRITNLLSPFAKVGSAGFQSKKSTLAPAFNALLPQLDDLARGGHIGAQSLVQNRDSALALVETNFTGIAAQWTALLAKYQNLVTRAIFDPSNPLAGFTDLPVGAGGSGPAPHYQMDGNANYPLHLASDVRLAITAAGNVGNLAAHYALTEYVLLNNLTRSVAFSLGGIGGLVNPQNMAGGFNMGNDQHTSGWVPRLLFGLLRWRACSACLLELISQLKAANMWNDTVIRDGGEFPRNPTVDGSGADHGFQGARYSFYSGAFNGPVVVGKLTSNDGRLAWGRGRVAPELGRQANLVDVAILTAHLLGVQAPFTSETPIVTLTSNGLQSRIGLADHA